MLENVNSAGWCDYWPVQIMRMLPLDVRLVAPEYWRSAHRAACRIGGLT